MSYLIDTNAWILFFQEDRRVNQKTRDLFENTETTLFVSIASIWEASIKIGIGKLRLPPAVEKNPVEAMEEYHIEIMPISTKAALAVKNLPPIHGDPFDRIQVCQAQEHGLEIVSADPIFERYGIKRHW